jgi:hypothetical protein
MFYKLFLNDLYLKLLDFKWFAFVVGILLLGNLVHGFFAFKSFSLLNKNSTVDDVKLIKKKYYLSLIVNFLTPYVLLISLFIFMKEFNIALIALLLLILMMMSCYFFDLKPTMKLK